ncbi:MAG: radical SAM protein [Spirochaetota bacterium]
MEFTPAYQKLTEKGGFEERIEKAYSLFSECKLCPRECNVNRRMKKGFCQAGDELIVSSYAPHFGEERVLVGRRGSGTIFFGYCNLRCVFCQNYELSFDGRGRAVSSSDLANMMLFLQNSYGCENINLVTPTHFLPHILEAIFIAAQKGLKVPIVYNCGGYESKESLEILDGVIDIYMPDFKFTFSESAKKYLKAPDYPQVVKQALIEMDRQVGGLKTNIRGLAKRGLLTRHLVMPGGEDESKNILSFIKENLSSDCLVNVMGQYYPTNQAYLFPEINHRLSNQEYLAVRRYAEKSGLRLC